MEDRVEDPATREALRYRSALRIGVESLKGRPLSTRIAEQVCTRIKGVDMTVRRVPGTALANPATSTVIYTPPVGEALLREKLANWERFIHDRTEIDPLVRMAVAHYQFEAIHPFTDGNGRTGRILNTLMLVE
jgi:Fic family protein